MKVLVTNDDGIASPGLWALADGLRDAGHEVVVVAPAEERSGAGAAIGHIVPGEGVAVSPVERPGWETSAWAVDGAPALCVLLALRLGAFGEGFEAVASGINPGWNTGRGVIHSGTVGAVLTAGNAGLPGVAVSIEAHTSQVGEVGLVPGIIEHWDAAASLAVEVVGWLGTLPPAPGAPAMVNLNAPNRPLGEVPGVRAASLSALPAAGLRRGTAPLRVDGRILLELGPPSRAPLPGSDNAHLAAGYATVTMLTGVTGGAGVGAEEAAQRLEGRIRPNARRGTR